METIKDDVYNILTNGDEFAQPLTIQPPTGDAVNINGVYSDHMNTYDESGMPITGKAVYVTISETSLIELSYTTRNAAGLIDLKGHLVTITYADESTRQYIVTETRPDYTINLIILVLGEYGGN